MASSPSNTLYIYENPMAESAKTDQDQPENTLPKGYEPKSIENKWRTHWRENKTFTPDLNAPGSSDKEAFCIVIPPPNVTGKLHVGHALNQTLQDILCRHARQLDKLVLWVPGTDHAGIATQNVVERELAKEGKTRHDLGREAFLERVWQWKEEYGGNIVQQIEALGSSVDWTRERFTMDEGLSRAVREVFVRLYKEKLIYKGDYIINWCNRCHTALADDEVEHTPRKTSLWHIRYPVEGGTEFITIATTRPETMLGDTAVCVHPDDERYTHLVGKKVRLPLVGRLIPIIADSYVEKEFGTGALKVTPSHDHNDWNLGHKHSLEFVQVIDDDGNMKENAGEYAGLSKEKARTRIVADLDREGFLAKTEDYEHSAGLCYRCKSVIEPHVSTQWFVAVKDLAAKARAAVPSKTQIFPSTWDKTYYNWLDNIRDWCISRQIWWGHRIPAWTCATCKELVVETKAPAACPKCGGTNLAQEDFVLDTWFSSALWPFSTLGWPDKTPELARFYPNTIMVTGFDILFFWVARMMMMGMHFMGEVPFPHVYLHALVRDGDGKKMSKSTGNVIDPIKMIETYGTDAFRFTLTAFAAMGRDIRLSEDRIEGYRHFANKIWNASRFALMNLPEDRAWPHNASLKNASPLTAVPLEGIEGDHHRWILDRLEEQKTTQKTAIAEYRFNDAANGIYKFIWNELCDWYLELVKPDMNSEDSDRKARAQYVLWTVLRESLILLHPLMPFISSEVWEYLPGQPEGKDLAQQLFPAERPGCIRKGATARMEMVQEAISAVRTIRAELNIPPSHRLDVTIRPADEAAALVLAEQKHLIILLARLQNVTIDKTAQAPKASASQVAQGNEIIVHLSGAIDFTAEVARLEKELAKLEKEYTMIRGKLDNEQYVAKAPLAVVEKDRARVIELGDARIKLNALKERFLSSLE